MIAVLLGLTVASLPLLWMDREHAGPNANTIAVSTPILIATVGALTALVFAPSLAIVGLPLLVVVKPLRRKVRALKDDRARVAAVPDALEVIAMAISAGMSISEMIDLVARCGPPALRGLFRSAETSLAVGQSRRNALHQLANEGGPRLAAVAEILIASDRDGASVALVLDRLAAEAGRARRLAAEERARRAPVLMLAPLTLCSLPAVLIGTVLPFVLLSFGQTSL